MDNDNNDMTIIDKDHLPEPVLNGKGQVIECWMIGSDKEVHHIVAGEDQHITRNGAIYNDRTHRIAKPGVVGLITHDNAVDYQARLQATKVKAALQSIANAAADGSTPSIKGGLRTIFDAQVEMAKAGNAYSTNAAKFLISQAGLDAPSEQNTGGVTIQLDAATAQAIIAAVESRRSSQ